GGERGRWKGIDPRSAEELRDAGVDVLTTGNHVWQNRDIIPYMRETDRLLRPLNFARDVPGIGWTVQNARRSDVRVGVVNLIGRVFMQPAECPFHAGAAAVEELRRHTTVIVVDMHAEATRSEERRV